MCTSYCNPHGGSTRCSYKFYVCVRTKQSCKSTKNTEKRSGNHIEYVDGITIYAIVRDTGRGPTNLAHSRDRISSPLSKIHRDL